MSRPSASLPSINRPSGGGLSGGGQRPSAGNRPSFGNLPTPGGGSIAGNRPNVSNLPGNRPGGSGRPSSADLSKFLDVSGSGGRPSGWPSTLPGGGGNLPGGAAAEFLHNQPGNRPTTLPANRPSIANRPDRPGGGDGIRPGGGGQYISNRPDRIPDRNQWNNWRQNNFTQVNNYFHGHWNNFDHWYDRGWWNNNYHGRFHWNDNTNWWAWATWGSIANWLPWDWNQPIYYEYGDNVYYEGDTVYYGDQPIATADEYAQQAEAIATSIPNVTPAEDDWMPLGVFAVTPDGQPSGVDPTMFLQLTVSKQGIIAGTFQNTATGKVQSIEGMVDEQTQRAAWTAEGQSRPLMETGLGNLTKDTASALVHFADGTTQQWLLVRLNQPDQAAQP
jgi:hypothetical protein